MHSDNNELHSLRHHFLIAMPGLEDSIFARSVTYICDHNKQGAMGVIINQPSELSLNSVFDQLDLAYGNHQPHNQVLVGGPVRPDQGLVIHRERGNWASTMSVASELHITTSKDIIEALADDGLEDAQLAFGYAGWGEGQLDEEVSNNLWLTMPADISIIFDTPVEQRWAAVEKQLGVDLNLLSMTAGHA